MCLQNSELLLKPVLEPHVYVYELGFSHLSKSLKMIDIFDSNKILTVECKSALFWHDVYNNTTIIRTLCKYNKNVVIIYRWHHCIVCVHDWSNLLSCNGSITIQFRTIVITHQSGNPFYPKKIFHLLLHTKKEINFEQVSLRLQKNLGVFINEYLFSVVHFFCISL